ncbi:hypothetical protein Poli38472_011297 [Pythium oligandrum]|uniref:AAA+ ATPase domain-containing protein n=1 Tax=Pythium oligandrum TaxID=41045 RepID=A0A8K1CS10_PYTOL|nr:hypothetical protein Poli38472_011297 [Pythium oligandrum]|eukprot:TMW67677.1 hypothetical protein Poli38472_011297 [Pythium oligandrum]
MAMETTVSVYSGDVSASTLLPHQLLLSETDATTSAVVSYASVVLSAPQMTSLTVLEVVVDRPETHGGLPQGCVQVHPWVLAALDCTEGDEAAIRLVELTETSSHYTVELAVESRYPTRLTLASSSASTTASQSDSAHGNIQLLPESVRSGLVSLPNAITRQLMTRMGTSIASLLPIGSLVPVQLLGETFVFRVSRVEPQDQDDDTLDSSQQLQVRVLGYSSPDESSVSDLTSRLDGLQLAPNDDDDDRLLHARLWKTGLAGYTSFIQDVSFHILLNFRPLPVDKPSESSLTCHGLLLQGVQGVGKSLGLQTIERELTQRHVPTWHIDATSLLMEYENTKVASAYEFLSQQFQQRFPGYRPSTARRARKDQSAAGVVLIDEIDVLFQPTNGQEVEQDGDQSLTLMPLGSALLRCLDAMTDRSSQRLCIVGTSTASSGGMSAEDERIPLIAKRSGRFEKTIEMIVPTEAMRREILARHLEALTLLDDTDVAMSDDASFKTTEGVSEQVWRFAVRLASFTGGYVAKDLVRICRNAFVRAQRRDHDRKETRGLITWDVLVESQRQVKPSQLQQLNVASPSTNESEDDDSAHGFAGYNTLRQQLRDFIEWKFHPTTAMKQLGIANASGVLIHGPSGCGKSLLVKALAAQAKVNVVSVKSSELLSKYFGDSERAVRQLFARARAASPCILFFDEFDSIAHKRSFGGDDGGGDGSGVYARILSTFLNEMDGVGAARQQSQASEILVIAATNRLEALDAALIRPGRIDKAVELGFPETHDQVAILQHYVHSMPIGSDVDVELLATRSTGTRRFTGADLAAVCKEAAFRALREDLDAQSVALRHFYAAWDHRVDAQHVDRLK